MSAITELTPQFRERVESTGMTHSAITAAIGVTKHFFASLGRKRKGL
ncbi:hypothetical protein [Arcanobacterium canis]